MTFGGGGVAPGAPGAVLGGYAGKPAALPFPVIAAHAGMR